MRGMVAKRIRDAAYYYVYRDEQGKVVPEQRRYGRNDRGDLVAIGKRGAIRAAKKAWKRRRREG